MGEIGGRGGWLRPGLRPGMGWRGDKGQGLVEYALILGFVCLVLVGALLVLGQSVSNLFQPILPFLV